MPVLADVIAAVESWYEPRWADGWDAVGLVCGDPGVDVTRIVVAVDAVPATVADAVGAQLLLTHHPLLLTAVHGVPMIDPKGALVHRMIRTGLAHYVAHTNAEAAQPGVSDALAASLGLGDVVALEASAARGAYGVGRVGELAEMTTLARFVDLVAARLPATVGGVRAAGDPDQSVRRVAVLAGSGSSLIAAARAAGADVYVTADLKHHNGVEAVSQRGPGAMALIDAAHWATEMPWVHVVADRLRTAFGDTVEVTVSEVVTDPWTVHAPSAPDRTPRDEDD